MSDLVTDSLMACAEQAGDINDTVYQHFFDSCTSAGQLMDHSDEGMPGRMLQETLELLMDEVGDAESATLLQRLQRQLLQNGVLLDSGVANVG